MPVVTGNYGTFQTQARFFQTHRLGAGAPGGGSASAYGGAGVTAGLGLGGLGGLGGGTAMPLTGAGGGFSTNLRPTTPR
jgi:hypothetical protein